MYPIVVQIECREWGGPAVSLSPLSQLEMYVCYSTQKSTDMKNSTALLFLFLVFFFPDIHSQDIRDYLILDEGVEEVLELPSGIFPQSDVYRISGFTPNAVVQISSALEGKQVRDLQLIVLTKPGALVFNNMSVTPDNIGDWSAAILEWKKSVGNQVVIYSDAVFTGEEGMELKRKLEEVSGLEFAMQNLNQ